MQYLIHKPDDALRFVWFSFAALSHHGQQRVLREAGMPLVVDSGGELFGVAYLLIGLPQHQESSVL